MTFQAPELFIWRGGVYHSTDEPLRVHLDELGIEKIGNPYSSSSCCWRGYIGTWLIYKNKLFLVALLDACEDEEIDIGELFPECGWGAFADWFTGTVRLPNHGIARAAGDPFIFNTLNYKGGYHELAFDKGVLTAEREIWTP